VQARALKYYSGRKWRARYWNVVDAAVSINSTWAKRGFTSLTGIVFVVSVDTGEVLDYHVLSKA